MGIERRPTRLWGALIVLLVPILGAAGPLPSRVVAYTGQVAPGTNGATFLILREPAINAKGSIAFRARITPASTNNNEGIWTERDRVLELYLREGDPAPIGTWGGLGNPNINDAGTDQFGRLVFTASSTLWQQRLDDHLDFANNALRIVAREGEPAPGTSRDFSSLGHFVANTSGQSVFYATLSGTGSPDSGIWFDDGSTVRLVVANGSPAPGFNAVFWGAGSPLLGGPSLTADGRSVFSAYLGEGTNPSIWQSLSGAPPTPVAVTLSGDSFLDGTEIGPSNFFSVNSTGQTAYFATIYSSQEGNIGAISVAPGRHGLVRWDRDRVNPTGSSLLLLDDGNVVFIGVEVDSPFRQGIYIVDGGAVVPLVLEGDLVPGLPGVMFTSQFGSVVANAKGRIAFTAFLSDNTTALFATSLGDDITLIAREGDTISLPTGELTINDVVFTSNPANGVNGHPRSISETNEVVWRADTTAGLVIMVTGVGEPPPAPPRLVGLEVVQVIQDWANSVPLVENKRTFVRAHFESNVATNLTPRLLARRGSGAFVPIKNSPNNGRVPVTSNASARRDMRNGAAFYELPDEWRTGSIELEVDLDGDELICRDRAPATTFDCRVSVSFEKVEKLRVQFRSLVRRDAGGRPLSVDTRAADDLAKRILSAYPVEQVLLDHRIGGEFLFEPTLDEAVAVLKMLRFADGCFGSVGCTDFYYGAIVKESKAGLSEGIPGSVAAGFVKANPRVPGRHTHSHEMGHLLGLHHAVREDLDMDGNPDLDPNGDKLGYCTEVAAPTAPDFPFVSRVNGKFRPTLGPMRTGENNQIWGYDSLLGLVVSPYEVFTLMSYCDSSPIDLWPSSHDYGLLKDAINARFKRHVSGDKGTVGDYRVVRGTIDFAAETIDLLPSLVLPNLPQPDNPGPGAFTLRLKDSGGGLLSSVSFDAAPYPYRGVAPQDEGDFLVAVPDDPDIAEVEVLMDGVSKATVSASPNPPTVDVLFPDGGENLTTETVLLSWTGSDLDGDPLTYVVQHSPDNALSWSTLAVDLSDTEFEVPRASLQSSNQGLIRVTASDGFNTGSDVSGATFTVANNDPAVFVDAPADGTLHVGGQVLTLRATALDTEDGLLDPAGIGWSSDLDGALGTGSPLEIAVSTLSDGDHLVTASATDGDGGQGSASITVPISQTAPASLVDLMVGWEPEVSAVFTDLPVRVPLRITNLGPDPASGVSVSFASQLTTKDTVSAKGASILALGAPAGWTCAAASCQTTELSLDEEAVIQVTLLASALGQLSVSADADGDETDAVTSTNSAVLSLDVLDSSEEIVFVNGFEG